MIKLKIHMQSTLYKFSFVIIFLEITTNSITYTIQSHKKPNGIAIAPQNIFIRHQMQYVIIRKNIETLCKCKFKKEPKSRIKTTQNPHMFHIL